MNYLFQERFFRQYQDICDYAEESLDFLINR